MDIIKSIEHEQLKNKIPDLKVGDTVRVHQRIKEGNRERIQVFEGIIIKKQGGGVNATFTVRRIASGVGVEKMMGYTNIDTEKGFAFFQKYLREKGIIAALEEKGIKEGDTVKIYDLEFDYYK